MADWITTLPGTEMGATLAVVCALTSAFFHALFGALQKSGVYDPFLIRGAFDFWILVLSAPVALFLVPWPSAPVMWVLIGALVIHFFYKLTMALAYVRAPYTVVYPVVRGSSPVVTVAAASLFFAESYSALQWLGIALLSGSIMTLSLFNIRSLKLSTPLITTALAWALVCGVLVAAYTTWDAYGIRLAEHPFIFLAWFFMVTSVDFPIIAYVRWRRMPDCPPLAPLMRRGILGALIAFVSFGGVMLATYLDKVGEAAVLRETSTVFAALIGWLLLKETVGPRRLILMILIALGAVIVEMG
ncbi:MAG: DMT family transporter [Pseudomonadota bacterium]